jgi:hypothetical protein
MSWEIGLLERDHGASIPFSAQPQRLLSVKRVRSLSSGHAKFYQDETTPTTGGSAPTCNQSIVNYGVFVKGDSFGGWTVWL